MDNILSQDEVDALLGAVEEGQIPLDERPDGRHGDQVVAEYSFRRPNLITRDQLRLFNSLHEIFARETASTLSLFLRANTDLQLVSTDQPQYQEFILSLPDVTHMQALELDTPAGAAILEVNLPLVYGIVDVLLGGTGEVSLEGRQLTEVEVAIAQPVLDIVVRQLETSLRAFMPVTVRPDRHESNPEYVRIAPPDAPVIVLTFDARIGVCSGIVNLCYPLHLVQALLEQMQGQGGQRTGYCSGEPPHDSRKQMFTALMDVPVRLASVLGTAEIRTRELLALQPGDVLVLDQRADRPARLLVDQIPMFGARPGRVNRNLAVKITERIRRHRDVPGGIDALNLQEENHG